MLFRVAWRRARMLAFLNPELDPKGPGFHIMQSLIAVGTGGIHGLRAHGRACRSSSICPSRTPTSSSPISAKSLACSARCWSWRCSVVLGYRGLRAALLSTDPFARFLAFGITTAILIQAFFNISVVLALLPTKGITLPLISSGGTSVFITLASLGVLLNVTREID